ncbi:MAG: SMP-30/gluconolactonase/LRE family protein, partial [Bacteroidales bacterium]|nr:SMP-30/gluconolactonase/LRE family protein [Bacteroidales bacterium]
GGFKHPLEDERYWGGQRALYSVSKDLKAFSDPRLLLPNFDSGQLDIFVTRLGDTYYTIFKDERYPSYEWPTGKTVRICSSKYLTGPYSDPGPPISPNFCEAPAVVPRLDGTGYYMYFERYQGQGYEIATAPTMAGPWYQVYKMEYHFEEDTRHGWVHPITQEEWDAIVAAYGDPDLDDSSIVAPGAKVERLADRFKFTEGPARDRWGNIFFTDQPNNKIWKWSAMDGQLTVFHDAPGRANGLYFDRSGDLLACSDENNELWSFDRQGNATILVKDYQGKKLNGPNDLWRDRQGGYYFTDPFYKRPWWSHKEMPQDGQHVYYMSADKKTVTRVIDDFKQPNGIIGTPDGKILYVADIKAKQTFAYDIVGEGKLANKRLFAPMGSDGMTIDNCGNV